eukprot:scaffold2981_cov105-Pinguiococcus_pyrenoidosus.AAC.1
MKPSEAKAKHHRREHDFFLVARGKPRHRTDGLGDKRDASRLDTLLQRNRTSREMRSRFGHRLPLKR